MTRSGSPLIQPTRYGLVPQFDSRACVVLLVGGFLLAGLLVWPGAPGMLAPPHSPSGARSGSPVVPAVATPRGTDAPVGYSASPTVATEFAHRTRVGPIVAQVRGNYQLSPNVAWLAYAPWNGYFYVAAPPSSVDVYASGAASPSAVIPAGNGTFAVAIDPALKEVFVTNNQSNNITVINGTTNRTIGSISVQSHPEGIAFDARDGTLFVANSGSNTVSVVNATTDAVIGNHSSGGAGPFGVVWDPATDHVYVSDRASNNVSEFDRFGNLTVQPVSVGSLPDGLAIDPVHDTIYVANEGSSNVSLINGTTGAISGSIPIAVMGWQPDLQSLAYDPVHGVMWLTAGAALLVLNTSSTRVAYISPYDPAGIAVNASGNVCFTNANNATFGCYFFTTAGMHAAANVGFSEMGLSPGSAWTISLTSCYGTQATVRSSSFTFGVEGSQSCNYSYNYSYQIRGPSGTTPTPSSGWFSVSSGGSTHVNVSFSPPTLYDVTFNSYGLPNGSAWSADIGGVVQSTYASSLTFHLGNGTYAPTYTGPAGWQTTPASRLGLTVNGGPVNRTVNWVQNNSSAPGAYLLYFPETGLPNGTSWNVTVFSATGSTYWGSAVAPAGVPFVVQNGTYTFAVATVQGSQNVSILYAPSPGFGNVTLAGSNLSVPVRFSPSGGLYDLVFTEQGLPAGTYWQVAVNGAGYGSVTTQVIAPVVNGSYTYAIGGAPGYAATPASGVLTVNGSAVAVNVSFGLARNYYSVTFRESGLALGSAWAVTLGNSSITSYTRILSFAEPNGTYRYSVGAVSDFLPTPSNGIVTVNGSAPPAVPVVFASTARFPVAFHETGLPNGTGWAVSIGSDYNSSSIATIELSETNGTYAYVVLPVTGYVAHAAGFVTVNGTGASVAVNFTPQSFPVVVVEFGLPNGTNWSVTVTNTVTGAHATYTTNGSAILLYLANGTYSFTVHASGYTATVSAPGFTIAGRLLGGSPTVQFRTSGSGTPAASLDYLPWLVGAIAAVAALTALGLLAAVDRRRRSQREGEEWIEELMKGEPPME
jgi:YVTN family beta-propeller protein